MLDGGINPARLKPLGIALAVLVVMFLAAVGINLYGNPGIPASHEERIERLARPLEPVPPLPDDIADNVHPFGNPVRK